MSETDRHHATLAGLALLPVAFVWKGYVLATVWAWFVASQFGAPALTIPQAIGISFVVGLLVYRHRPADPSRTLLTIVLDALLMPAFTLGFAWVVKGFL